MNDFAISLRTVAAYKAGEDLAVRLATAVSVQQAMSEALMKAADEIARLRLTADERAAIAGCIAYDETAAATLRKLLERMK